MKKKPGRINNNGGLLKANNSETKVKGHPGKVARFYNEYNEAFLKVYGNVIQAFRTTDTSILLDYQAGAMELKPGQKVLDAGCGVCGPAIHFAKNAGVEVHGVTVSQVQIDKATLLVAENDLQQKVFPKLGDYHKLPEYFEKSSFDVVYFLESFGHSHDKAMALEAAWKVLKPGGVLYIKDLFRKIPVLPEHNEKIDIEIEKINKAYKYYIADLYDVLHTIRKMGFILVFLKTIDLKIEEFENLTISNDFQELTGIGKIENWDEYIFPVDFFEIKCIKPVHELGVGASRYFLQNLYHMKVFNKKAEDL